MAPAGGSGAGSAFARVLSAEEAAANSVDHFFASQHDRATAAEAKANARKPTIEQRSRDAEALVALNGGAQYRCDAGSVSPAFHGAYHFAHTAARGYDCDVCGETYTAGCPACSGPKVSVLLFTVTFHANLAHSLTRSP